MTQQKFSIEGNNYTLHFKITNNVIEIFRSENKISKIVGCPVIEKDRFRFENNDSFWHWLQLNN